MKNFTLSHKVVTLFAIGTLLLFACTKEKFDTIPLVPDEGSITFTPEYYGTPASNQTDSLVLGYGKFVIKSDGVDSSIAEAYFDIDGLMYVPFIAPYPEHLEKITYYITISTPKFKGEVMPTGMMNWSSTTAAAGSKTGCTLGYFLYGERHDNAWRTVRANSNINFNGLQDSYIKFNFTKIYKLNIEKRGVLTFADGTLDVTLLGAAKHPFGLSTLYYGQAHLVIKFNAMELEYK